MIRLLASEFSRRAGAGCSACRTRCSGSQVYVLLRVGCLSLVGSVSLSLSLYTRVNARGGVPYATAAPLCPDANHRQILDSQVDEGGPPPRAAFTCTRPNMNAGWSEAQWIPPNSLRAAHHGIALSSSRHGPPRLFTPISALAMDHGWIEFVGSAR